MGLCWQLANQVRRLAATIPVVVFGEMGPVDGVMTDIRRVAPGREYLSVDVWLRLADRKLVKRSLVLYHGPGDIDGSRV